jgi:hypothetical protein
MLITPGPVAESTSFKCRIDLDPPIMGQDSLLFEASCQWSRKNVGAGRWESGFQLKVTGIDAELIQYLMLNFRLQGREAREIPDVKMIEMKNRRESIRYEFDRPLAVYEKRSYRQIGELADLSLRGARIISRRKIKKGVRVQCRVRLPKEIFRQEYLLFETKCMWSVPIGDDHAYESGHSIVNIERPHEVIIVYLLIHYGKPQPAGRQQKVVG